MSTTSTPSTEGGDIRNPFFARVYDKVLQRRSSRRDAAARVEVLAGLTGTVAEIGPGKGPNFPHYPASVDEVIAVEPEPYLRNLAQAAAGDAPVPIRVVPGTADEIPLEDASVDAVVFALVLCSVPDQASAIAEARRVLRPGGELRIYEHVVPEHAVPKGILKAAEVTFWRRAFGNCHPTRDTRAALAEAGFDVSEIRRYVQKVGPVEPPLPYILGRAVPAASGDRGSAG